VRGEEAARPTNHIDQAGMPKESETQKGLSKEGNETSPQKEVYYPRRTRSGIPIDDKMDQYFADALFSFTKRSASIPKFSRIPSWHWAMLNDIQRNSAYRIALTKAVAQLKSEGKEARVLDIGSGTGLLAMMAARAGADHVTTCEQNEALVAIAQENVKRAHTRYPMCTVVVIGKLSTNITVGPGLDMEKKANILVSEIVDSMLLRESIIPTLHHAMDELVQPDAIIIPWGGKLTFMVFESKEMRDTRYLDGDVSGFDLSFLNEAAYDLNAQEFLPDHNYRALSNPVVGMDFEFANVTKIETYEFFALNFTVISDGVIDGVVMWLDLNLYEDITLSCDPRVGKVHDPHWQHVIFFPRFPVKTQAGDVITMLVGHGETSVRAKIVYLNGVPFGLQRPYRSLENAYDPQIDPTSCSSKN